MATSRIIKNAAATITHVWTVGETATDPAAATYGVVDANGTTVVAPGTVATIPGGSTGLTTFSLAAQTSTRLLTVTWSATVSGVARVETDTVEVVSGFYFSLAEGRASDTSLASAGTYSTAALTLARDEVEVECEAICDRAFLPRYARVVLAGTGTMDLLLAHPDPSRSVSDVRAIRRIAVAPAVDETFVDLTVGQLAAVAVLPDGTLRRTDGATFTEGSDNVVVEYEYGLSEPPVDLRRASLVRLRSRLNIHRSGIPDRASSFTIDGGGTYRIELPGPWKTGIPEVDGPYSRYSRRSRTGTDGGPVPASRSLSYDPQWYSLFHGGRR